MVTFMPDGAGQYKVVAMVNNHHIHGSPLNLDVKPFSPELTQAWRQEGGEFSTVNSDSPITLPHNFIASEKPFQVQLVIRGKNEQFTVTTDVGCHVNTSNPTFYCNAGGPHDSGYSRCAYGNTLQPAQWQRCIQVSLMCPGCSHSTWYCPWSNGCGGKTDKTYWQVPLSLQTSLEVSQRTQ